MEKATITQDQLVEIEPTISKDAIKMSAMNEVTKKTYSELYDYVGDFKIVAPESWIRDVGLDPESLNGKVAFCVLSLFKKKGEESNIASWFTVSNRNPHITTHVIFGYQYLEQKTLLGGNS